MGLKKDSDLTTQRQYKKKNSQTSCSFQVLPLVLLLASLFQFQLFNGVEATTTTTTSESNPEKGSLKSNGESVQFSPSPSTTTTSLFDSLPLNGAFVTVKESTIPSLNRNPSLKRFKIKVRNPSHFNGSTVSLSSPTVLKNLNNKVVKNTTAVTTTREITEKMDMEKEKNPSASSLFDLLPNQGAMSSTTIESGSTSHDQGDKNPNPRNQRSPLKLNKRFDASFSGGFEIEPQNPTSEFSLSFFNENVLPPIIKKLTQDDNPEITRLSPPVELKASGGYSSSSSHSSSSSSSYQPPPQFIRQPYQNPQPSHNSHYKVATAIREPSSNSYYNKKPNVGPSSSGGSTVIIYANPQSPSKSPIQGPPPIRNTYGPPSPFFPPPPPTTTASPVVPKNEIHYHYHINTNDDNKLKSTTTTTSPPTIYGKPIETVAPPPPRNYNYRPPIRNRKPNSGYGLPPPPSRNTYLPPPKNNNNGGYSTPESSQKGGGYSNSGQTQEQTSGGYSSSSSSSTFNNQKDSFHNNDEQQIVPIITGNSGRRGNSERKKNQNNLGLLNLDYTNDDERDNTDDYQDDEKFRSRTLFTINKFQERDPSNPSSSSSNSFPPIPSNSYGPPPPASSQNSNSYGPPAPPQYGPSSPAPPLNNDNPSSQSQSAQTSITLETIPITTTETRFVTVPKITQTLGGTLQQNLQNNPLPPSNDSPSGGYSGSSSSSSSFIEPPPAPNRNNNNNNNNFLSGLNQNPRNILNEQLLQLNPSRGGLPDFSDIETLAFLQAQNNNNNNNPRNTNPNLLSELLLSQYTNGNNNNNNFRGSVGSNLFGNSHQASADLRTLSLLSNPINIGSGLRTNYGHHQPQPFSISPNNNNNVPILHSNAGGFVGGAGQLQSLRGGSTVLTGDAVGAISDLIREQRLQLAVSDLRNRLRNQHRDADRTRSNYRNLFYKGALLLAGLSLIPTVSTVVSPGLAAAAMIGAGSTASSSSAFTLSSSLLPLTTGRRRRDVHGDDIQIVGSTVNPSVRSMEKLFDDNHGQFSSTFVFPNMTNNYSSTRTTRKSNIGQLTNNTNTHTKRTLRKKYMNNLEKVKSSTVKATTPKQSLFDSMAFKGAFIPQEVRHDLEKYLPLDEIMKNSQCLQKYFCETLLQIETFPDPTPILLLYAGLSGDVDKNPWLQEAMTAARNQNCAAFYCYRAI